MESRSGRRPLAPAPTTSDGAAKASRFHAVRRELIPVVVLLLGVLVMAYFVATRNISTWTGPGFSMFSTVDHQATRWVRLTVTTEDRAAPAELPEDLKPELEKLRDAPNEAKLEELAAEMSLRGWEFDDGILRPGGPESASRIELSLITVHVDGDSAVTRPIHVAVVTR